MAMQWQTMDIPLASGLDTKSDERSAPMDKLSVLENGEFVNPGGIQKRNGYSVLGTGIVPSGTVADGRALASRGDELLLLTKDSIYSYSDSDDGWIGQSTYIPTKITEKTIYQKSTDQTKADRAELSNVIVWAWEDSETTSVHVRCVDKVSGTPYVKDYDMGSLTISPKLIALTTRIILILHDGTSTLKAVAIDPNNVAATCVQGGLTNLATDCAVYGGPGGVVIYDACKATTGASPTFAAVYYKSDTQYVVLDVAQALTVTTTSTKTRDNSRALAIAYENKTQASLIVVRVDGTPDIKGDNLVYPTLADYATVDVTIEASVGTLTDITVQYKDTTDASEYRAYVFWSEDVGGGGYAVWHKVSSNWMDTGNTVGTTVDPFVGRSTIESRGFLYDGDVYVILGRQSSLQASYFLYRSDGTLIAKLLGNVGAALDKRHGTLPNVQILGSNEYGWAGIHRRRVNAGSTTDYADKGIKDCVIEFDAPEGRMGVEIGKSVYFGGGQISMYDGTSIVESGFHEFPELVAAVVSAGGSLTASKTYTYRIYYEWENAQGEIERSTYAELTQVTTTSSDKQADLSIIPLAHTLKKSDRSDVRFAIYRSEADPGVGAPFYRVTSLDPTSTGDNSYLENDPGSSSLITWSDTMSDVVLVSKELDYQNSGELDNVGPSSCSVVATVHYRILMSGYEDPNLIRFSKLRFEGDAVSYNDALTIRIPQSNANTTSGGKVIAIHSMNQALVVFMENEIYSVPGVGPNNLGQGSYGTPQLIPSDVGCSDARIVVQTPMGVIFLTTKGFYLLTSGFQVKYIGGAVESFNSQTYVSADLVDDKHQVRFLTDSGSTVIYDYLVDQWSTWTAHAGEDAINYKGTYYYLVSDVVRKQATTYLDSTTDYGLVVETAWIKLGEMMGFNRIRRIGILGEHENAHQLRVRIAYDYLDTWVDDVTWTPNPTTNNAPERFRMRTQRQKCSAIKIRIEDTQLASADRLEGLKLTSLTLEIGRKAGIRRLPAVQTE